MKIKVICGGSTSLSFIKVLKHLSINLSTILRNNGRTGLIQYLKVCSLCLQQAASDYLTDDVTPFGMRCSRTKGGKLPRIIPARHRLIIHNKAPGYTIYIKFYLSLFYMYRVVSVDKYKVNLNTITDLGKQFDARIFSRYVKRFIDLFVYEQYRLIPSFYMKRFFKLFSISRSSPLNFRYNEGSKEDGTFQQRGPFWSTHPLVMMRSAMALSGSPIAEVFNDLAKAYAPRLSGILRQLGNPPKPFERMVGKLAFKEEAAGKLRVFAIVDCFTQWLLYPLHKLLFSILKRVPMDGTFNQLKPVYRLLRRKPKALFSLDLTAATDRLPVSIQIIILNELIQEIESFGDKWAKLLVGRTYRYTDPYSNEKGFVSYSVGQPMGALSSWAMLALTHHFIVQIAAWRTGWPKHRLFTEYALLGDDIVIGHRAVAKSYLSLMDEIGVGINLSKSVLSYKGTGLEFAKRTIIDGIDCSPISLRDLSISLQPGAVSSWVAFAKAHSLDFNLQRKVLGFGYRTCLNSFRRMCHALQVVFLANVAKVDYNTQVLNLRNKVPVDLESLLPQFKDEVLKPAIRSMLTDLNQIPKQWLDAIYIFTKMDATNARYLSTLADKCGWSKQDILSRFEAAAYQVNHSDSLKVHKDLSKAFKGIYDLNKIKSMDEALQAYFKLISDRATVNMAMMRLENVANKPSSKLPFQARLFRNWSRLSHSLIKRYKANKFT